MRKYWAKAIGDKSGRDNKEVDIIAVIRTGVIIIYIVTNIFLIAGIVRHW